MSLANDLAKSKYRPRHRNAKGLAAAGILFRDNPPLRLPHHRLAGLMPTPDNGALLVEHACAPRRAGKLPCWIKIWGIL